jgi:hypothetical protein
VWRARQAAQRADRLCGLQPDGQPHPEVPRGNFFVALVPVTAPAAALFGLSGRSEQTSRRPALLPLAAQELHAARWSDSLVVAAGCVHSVTAINANRDDIETTRTVPAHLRQAGFARTQAIARRARNPDARLAPVHAVGRRAVSRGSVPFVRPDCYALTRTPCDRARPDRASKVAGTSRKILNTYRAVLPRWAS